MSERMVIAIDGPAGSGKSTSAKLVAQKLNFLYIDTGAMYRAITFLAIKKNILSDKAKISELAEKTDIELTFENGKTSVKANNIDITEEIRSQVVNENVSDVSKIEEVRAALVKKQQKMGSKDIGVVMEGRDIGTVVFPNADVKIFLTCSIDERTNRRFKEFAEKGKAVSETFVKNNLLERDRIDSTRDISPLMKAPDAVEIDTSDITIEEQVNRILEIIKTTANKKKINLELK
ncbi:MAG: (d)CMP kinase [Ignavibacteriaceae bacterium]|nr:(d)CMP kinase [Ignavibacteriaceae bacterium]